MVHCSVSCAANGVQWKLEEMHRASPVSCICICIARFRLYSQVPYHKYTTYYCNIFCLGTSRTPSHSRHSKPGIAVIVGLVKYMLSVSQVF